MLAGLVSCAATASAQGLGALAGTVFTAEGARPLVGALLLLRPLAQAESSLSATSAADGAYRFDDLAPGQYRLTASHAGYLERTAGVEVTAGATITLSISLEPIIAGLPAADSVAIITGRVLEDATGHPLAGAEVSVEGTQLRATTDSTGRYLLVSVPPGPQVIRARRMGYAMIRMSVNVPHRGVVQQDLRIARSALTLEGITVTGDAVSRAAGELGTATVIESDAIRNQTATSLRGVLELVPGIDVQPAGLDDIQQIALRVAPTSGRSAAAVGTGTESAAAFGTLIILDGVPVSNNANLQGLGRGNELDFTTNAGGGIDLRRIPARTVERVEVIRGVPSARYGDLTQGAIVVETRAGAVDPEIAVQFDERTVEASLVAGRRFGGPNHAGTVSLDWSRTRSQPGLTQDAAFRFAGQLAHRLVVGKAPAASTLGGRFLLDTRVDVFQLRDDRPTTPGLPDRSLTSRDRGLRVSERARVALSRRVDLTLTGSISLLQQRNSATTPLSRGPMPVTTRLTEGRAVGSYVIGPYLAAASTAGDPHAWFGRLEAEAHPAWLSADHMMRVGAEFRREWSTGAGYQFDITNPPQVTFNGVNGFARPRSYDSIPPLVASALYVDDRLSLPLGEHGLLAVQAGMRLDLLHRGSTWFSSVRDAELGPRLNVELSPRPWLRLRGGWGLVAKSPSLAQLFPAPQYYDVINVNWFTNDPAERLAVLTTFVNDPINPQLGFAVASKAEAGVEIGPGSWAVSLVAFRDRIRNAVAEPGLPGYLLRDHYDLTDSTRGTGVPPDIVEPAAYSDTVPTLLAVPRNVMTLSSRGFELQALLPEIRQLHTRVNVTGQWIETRQYVDAPYFGSASAFGSFALSVTQQRTPYWGAATELGRRAILTYRVIHQQPALGLVLTAIVQHNLFDHVEDLARSDTLAFVGYVTRAGELVPVPESERGDPQYADLHVTRSGTLGSPRHTPGDWLLSVQVSKTFPLGGRLSFWAFNVLDRRGTLTESNGIRLYGRMRFGLELSMPVRGLVPWLY